MTPALPIRRTAAWVLAAAVTATVAVAISGCASPLANDPSDHGFGAYSAALIARSVTDGQLMAGVVPDPTLNKGVRELARVDATGPGDAVTPADAAATNRAPATGPAATLPATTANGAPPAYGGGGAAALNSVETAFPMSLQDAIYRALRNNLDIKVEAYNPAIKEAQIVEAQAIYDPVLFAQSQWANTDQPGAASGGQPPYGVTMNNNAGVRQLLPTGGTVQGQASANYWDVTNNSLLGAAGSSHSSAWAPNIGLALSQPLLRGFGSTVTNANIFLAQRDRRIALTQFRRRVIETTEAVEEAYHNLAQASASVTIEERLLSDTRATFDMVQARIKIDADQTSLSQAAAQVERTNADLILARSQYRTASDRLKALLNDPEVDLRSNVLIVPTDRPTSEPIIYNVAEQVDVALRQRTELQEARLQVEKADIVVDVSRNDLLPKADMTLSVQSNGTPSQDLGRAFNSTWDAPKFIDYAAGLKFEMPIGNREAQARYKRRLMERRQALTNMVRVAQTVVLDVKLSLRSILSTYEEIGARERARVAAGRELAALTAQQNIRALTPEFLRLKLDAQQRLANAEFLELQALVNYNIAIAKLEQAKGTLLEYNRIALDAKPPEVDDKGRIRFLDRTYPEPGK